MAVQRQYEGRPGEQYKLRATNAAATTTTTAATTTATTTYYS